MTLASTALRTTTATAAVTTTPNEIVTTMRYHLLYSYTPWQAEKRKLTLSHSLAYPQPQRTAVPSTTDLTPEAVQASAEAASPRARIATMAAANKTLGASEALALVAYGVTIPE